MEEPCRQKRNKPCENCRSHRRKCVNFNKTICERCHKLELECIYKITEKPSKSYKSTISSTKRNKLFEAIWTLKEETDDIQLQLSQLKSNSAITAIPATDCTCSEPSQCSHSMQLLPTNSSSRWELTISSNRKGTLHLQTTVQSMSDLSTFMKEAFSFFKYNRNEIIEQLSETGGKQILPVTMKTLKVEKLVRKLVTAAATHTKNNNHFTAISLLDHICQQHRRRLKLQVIKDFFDCGGLLNPVLIYPYHYPILTQDPDSLLATAVAAMTAYSKCQHIDMTGYPFTRDQFAESCRIQAKLMLEDVLFESEPSLEIALSIWAICFSSLLALKGKEARFQSNICWRMVIQLKSTYIHQQNTTIEDNIKAESWKRLFYVARYIEFNFHMIFDQAKDFSSIAHHLEIELPTPLPCEAIDDQLVSSVFCFRYVAQLTINSAGASKDNEAEISGLRLLAGVIDRIPSTTIQYLENALLHTWNNIPASLRLGSGPFQYIEPKSLEDCKDPCILRFNVVYYIYWMNLQTRVMQSPKATDLTGAAFGRIDGDRALIIVSICTDAATNIFKVLSYNFPCVIELHWLTMCVEVVKLLSAAANTLIRNRAKVNLKTLINVMKLQLDAIGNNDQKSSSPNAPYLNRMKQVITSYMASNKICII